MSKHGPLLLLAVWLAVNLFLFARHGVERIETDLEIGSLAAPHERRAAAWSTNAGEGLRAIEPALAEVARMQVERVLILAPPGTNFLVSAAIHDLFPAQVVVRNPVNRPVQDLRAAGRDAKAQAVIWLNPQAQWKALRVEED